MGLSPENERATRTLKKALLILAGLALVVLVPLGVRSFLLSEGRWVTCRITTPAGEIRLRVYPDQAPVTAANFLRYVEAGLYNGSTFFRVVTADNQPDDKVRIEVVQGGDVPEDKCFPPIAHETTKVTGLRHRDGTVSMARAEPGTATSSFFICIGRQRELDFGGRRNPDGQGFAAFGRVVKGMDVVRRIQAMEQEKQLLKKPVPITSCIRMLKPSEVPGNLGRGSWRTGGIRDIFEQLRFSLRRMTFTRYAVLVLFLALSGWLAWRGYIRNRWARGESPAWEGSSWAAARGTATWLRALELVVFLLLLALLAIMLIGP